MKGMLEPWGYLQKKYIVVLFYVHCISLVLAFMDLVLCNKAKISKINAVLMISKLIYSLHLHIKKIYFQ